MKYTAPSLKFGPANFNNSAAIFGDWRGELAGMDEFQLRGLCSHRLRDLFEAMADEIDRGRS